MDFEMNERTYHAVTDSTSRNHDFISTGGGSNGDAPQIGFDIPAVGGRYYVVLEPGQNSAYSKYTFYVYVDGCDIDSLISPGLEYVSPASANSTIESCTRQGTSNCWKVVVKADDSASHDDVYTFNVRNAAGADSKDLTVKIRKVTKCEFSIFNYEVSGDANSDHVWAPTTGTSGAGGSVYNNSIDLGAQNWQNESSQIVGTDSSIPGGLGYDASPWNYVNPTEIKVFFKMKNGSTWVNAPAGTGTYTVTYGSASPTLQVRLSQDLANDLYVIVVASHSGSITGNPNSASDPYRGVSSGDPNSKVWTIDHRNINYGTGGHAYYDVIKIKAGEHHFGHGVGAGIRRGCPACMVLNWDANAETELIAEIKRITGITNTDDIRNNNGGRLKYSTILYYTPIDANGFPIGPEKYVVLYNGTNWGELINDYKAIRLRESAADIFKLGTAYSINWQLNVYYNNQLKGEYPHSGSVAAAEPYVYDSGDGKFHDDKFTETDPKLLSGNGSQTFAVYIDGVFLNSQKVKFKCQYKDAYGWHDCPATNTPVSVNSLNWAEGTLRINNNTETISSIILPDGRTYQAGPYNENESNINNIRANLETFTVDKSKMTTGTLYRVVFDTTWNEGQNISTGTIGGDASQVVSVTNPTPQQYTLGGEWYFRK